MIEDSAILPTGNELLLDVPDDPRADPFVRVRLRKRRDELALVAIPYPREGTAGGTITVATSGRRAVVLLYSGQGENTYLLIEIGSSTPTLDVNTRPYRSLDPPPLLTILERLRFGGLLPVFAFSPDETRIAMLDLHWPHDWSAAWQPEPYAELVGDAQFVGTLRIHDVATSVTTVHEFGLVAASDPRIVYDPVWLPDRPPQFLSADRIRLSMPWGSVDLSLPLPASIELRP